MQTRINYSMTFAAVLLAVTCSVSLAQAGGFGGFGGRMGGGGGFYRGGGSRLGGSIFRNNGQKYNHSNNNYNNNSNGWKNYPSNQQQQHVYKHNNGNHSPVIVNNPQPTTPSVGDAVNNQQHNGSTHHKPDFLNNHKFQSNNQNHNNLGDKTQGPANGNTGVAGGLQPKHLPGKVIDPGIGNGSGNGNPPLVVQHQPHSPKHTHPPHHHHHNWSWVGFAAPWVYGVGNYRNGGYTTPTVINNTTVIEQPVVQASATEPAASDVAATGATAKTTNEAKKNDQVPDLTLKSISLFSAGSIAAGEGPVYRVVIANTSSVDVDRPFTVTVVAAKEDRSFDDNTPRTDEPVVSLAAGKEEGIDIHLPVEALSCEKDDQGNEAPFSTLLVVIDGYAKLGETNRDNNAAAVARTDVNAILPIVDSAETVAASGSRELNIAGQSFGEEQGKLMLDLGTVRVPAEVVSWEADSIKAKLPNIETAASVTTKLVVVRADGVSAEPFDLTQQDVAAK